MGSKLRGNVMKWLGRLLKKILIAAIVVILIFILIIVGIDLYVKISANKYIKTDNEIAHDMQAIVVLGARVTPQKTPCPMLKDRLDKSIELYRDEVAPIILVSGDHRNDYYNEVGVMKDYLVKNGVKESDVIMDHAGYSTYDSMLRAVSEFNLTRFVVVTQNYHLKRAVYIGRSNADVFGVPAEHYRYAVLPKYYFREVFARIKDFFLVIVNDL